MSSTLLVIYEEHGEEWATYLSDIFKSYLHLDGIILCNLDSESEEILENLSQAEFHCKLIILTSYLLEIFYRNQASHFFQCLHPSHRLVLLLCGVESPEGFYEIFPLERNCHVILSEQDPQEYISIVSSIINEDCEGKGIRPSLSTPEDISQSNSEQDVKSTRTSSLSSVLVLPKRISCENPDEIFIILQQDMPSNLEVQVEFCTENAIMRRQPLRWNEKILCLKAMDFPPGQVTVKVYCGNDIIAATQVEYYSIIQDLKLLLSKAADPVAFICQAFDVYTLEDLDKVLASSLQNRISSCEYSLQEIKQQAINGSSAEIPTLLHCAAKLGLKKVALLLLQSPIVDDICQVTNKYGDDPAKIAEKNGHKDIQEIILHLTKKREADCLNIPEELLQQEEIYVDMVKNTDADQHSPKDVCTSVQGGNVNVFCGSKLDAQENPAVNKQGEIDEEHGEYNGSDDRSRLIDDYCHSIPADSPSGPFTNDALWALQDKLNKKEIDEEWLCGATGNGDIHSLQEPKCVQNSGVSYSGNIYVPLPVNPAARNLPINEESICDSKSLYPSLPPEQYHDSKEVDGNENATYGENPDEEDGNDENNEEPLLVATTEDDVYIVFETNAIPGERQNTFACNAAAPEKTMYIAEAIREDNEKVTSGDADECGEDGNDNEWSEEPLVVASTEDDMYIIFETNAKDTRQRQDSYAFHRPAALETTFKSTIETGASYHFQERRNDSFPDNCFWDEDVDESNEEDPYSLAYSDDVYMELPLEPADEVNPRTKRSFIALRAPAPTPRPEAAAPQPEDSYISRVFRQKQEERKVYSTGPGQDKLQMMKPDDQVTPQHHIPSGQEELILLQEKVKRGMLTMDEAIQKFKQWQAEKSGRDLLQQKKLQKLRENIIGDKPDDDKLTIVHQPCPNLAKPRNTYGMFDNNIYQDTRYSTQHPIQQYPKKEYGLYGKLPYNK